MNKKRVLVVDDLPDWQKTLKGFLSDEGFEVKTAGSVRLALEAVNANRFDLAIVDIRLDETNEEDVNGLNLAFEIKKLDPNMKIIILTGYASIDLVRKAMEPNATGKRLADDFISKDKTDELLEIVQRLLAKHS